MHLASVLLYENLHKMGFFKILFYQGGRALPFGPVEQLAETIV